MLVAASDSRGIAIDPSGLDIERLIAIKNEGGSVRDYSDAKKGTPGEIVGVDCDIWIPAARPDVIRADNVGELKAKLVVQGANIPVTPDAEVELHRRGVLSIPDFIANAGGVICAAVEYAGGSRAVAFQTIEEKIRANTEEVLLAAESASTTPRENAEAMAQRRVLKAMEYRR